MLKLCSILEHEFKMHMFVYVFEISHRAPFVFQKVHSS